MEKRIERLEAEDEKPEEIRTAALDLYRDTALPILDQARTSASNAAQFAEQARLAPKQIAQAEAQLRSPPFPAPDLSRLSLEDLERKLTQAREARARLQGELALLDEQLRILRNRPALLAQELSEARQKLEAIEQELQTPPSDVERIQLAAARTDALRARRLRRTVQIRMLEMERASLDVRIRLTQVQRDVVQRRLTEVQEDAGALEDEVTVRRADAAAQARLDDAVALQQARAADTSPLLIQLAETNAVLSAELQQVEEKLGEISREREEVEKRMANLRERFDSAKELLDLMGASGAAGHELRFRRKRLPAYRREWHRHAAMREAEIQNARLRSWKLDQELTSLQNRRDAWIQEVPEDLRPEARRLLNGQTARLRSLEDAWGRYRRELVQLDAQEQAVLSEALAFRAFLDAHLLWTRSMAPIGPHTLAAVRSSLDALIDPASWRAAGRQLLDQLRLHPAASGVVLIAVAVLLLLRRRIRARLRHLAKLVSRMTTDGVLYTPEAVLWTAIQASPAAVLLWFAGWLLGADPLAPDEVRAIGAGLSAMAGLVYGIIFFRGILREQGVGRAHFRWPAEGVARVSRHLRWFVWVVPPLGFIVVWSEWLDVDTHRAGLGLLSFEGCMGLLALLLARCFFGENGIIDWFGKSSESRWSWKTLEILLRVLTFLPLLLGVLALLGYHYTAVQLSERLVYSLVLIGGVTLIYVTIRRMLALAEMRMELRSIQQQRTSEIEAAKKRGTFQELISLASPTGVGVGEINAQMRRLVQIVYFLVLIAGVLGIWAPTLPALSVLDNVTLWRVAVEGAAEPRIISLGSLLLSFLVLLLTLAAARNLPGLLEILILEPLKVDPGSRYATTTVTRYVITAIGLVAAFNQLGLGWSQVQWLVAALGVGLGFGLQEIFANFVSGLIILFERPIRVGDIVTIGEVTGLVSRIRIRATTITDWDRKEYVVPNKEFVTGRLLNWTLSDKINRVVLPVGIAYGSNTEKARSLLFEICREEPLVLNDPAPLITFDGFGDSTLNFTLRAYLPNLDNRLEAVHRLHTAIHGRFHDAGIEIAFPQRDLHIRSAPPEWMPPGSAPGDAGAPSGDAGQTATT